MQKVSRNPQPSTVRRPSSCQVRRLSDDLPMKSSRRWTVGASRSVGSLAVQLESKGFVVDEQVTVVESGNRNEKIRMMSPVMSRVIVHNNTVYSGKAGDRCRQKGSTASMKRKSALPPPNMQKGCNVLFVCYKVLAPQR